MTVKDFFKGAFYLPAKTFSVLTDLLLGSYKRDTDGNIKPAPKGQPNTNSGLLGFILNSILYVARGVSNFIYNHQTAIATAFWLSLLTAGAAALTVFLWPAALTAVATFSVYGLSIAGIVGAEAAAQIGAIAALTFAATSAATYVVAGFVNTINWIRSCFAKKPTSNDHEQQDNQEDSENGNENDEVNDSPKSILRRLERQGAKKTEFEQNNNKDRDHAKLFESRTKKSKGQKIGIDEVDEQEKDQQYSPANL